MLGTPRLDWTGMPNLQAIGLAGYLIMGLPMKIAAGGSYGTKLAGWRAGCIHLHNNRLVFRRRERGERDRWLPMSRINFAIIWPKVRAKALWQSFYHYFSCGPVVSVLDDGQRELPHRHQKSDWIDFCSGPMISRTQVSFCRNEWVMWWPLPPPSLKSWQKRLE